MPEPLKGNWAGWWSRRITLEHRLVYQVTGEGDEETLFIAQCRYHYYIPPEKLDPSSIVRANSSVLSQWRVGLRTSSGLY